MPIRTRDGEPDVLLRASDIEEWKSEWAGIDDAIKEADAKAKDLRVRRAKLSQLLQGAVAFSPELSDWLKVHEEARLEKEAKDAPDDVALTEAILRVLKQKGTSTRDKIRQNLPAQGYSSAKIQSNPNYLYTALARLVDRGKVVENPTGIFKLKS